MSLSHISVAYLNYPTKVMFKCCKLIPVMIGGVLIQGDYNIYSNRNLKSDGLLCNRLLNIESHAHGFDSGTLICN